MTFVNITYTIIKNLQKILKTFSFFHTSGDKAITKFLYSAHFFPVKNLVHSVIQLYFPCTP